MSRLRKRIGLVSTLAVLAGAFAVTSIARAQAGPYDVQVGHFFGFGGANCNEQTGENCRVQAESMRFLPSSLNVPKGDLVHFVIGFHTATLMAANTDIAKWVEDNATGIGEPWNFLSADPDADVAGGPVADNKFNPQVFFPSAVGCGESQSNPCVYNGAPILNSGLPFAEFPGNFWVKIDADVGDTVWVVCSIHPHMRLRINVVAAGQGSDPAAAQQAVQQTLASDLELAQATHNRMVNIQSKHVAADGTVVWDAWAGFDAHFVSLDEMYPSRLRIKKGDRVRWHLEGLINEHHTVTFPFGTGRDIANNEGFLFNCDPDGDGGAGPDVPAAFDPATGPSCAGGPSQLEIEFSNRFGLVAGNGRFTGGSDYENSGVRTGSANVPQPQAAYTLQFTRLSPDRGFRYICMVHGPGMAGRVFVSA